LIRLIPTKKYFSASGNFSLDDGLLSLWTKRMNEESLAKAFGNVLTLMLNAAFPPSPIDYIPKYFFEK
jgi:hypothetical protein